MTAREFVACTKAWIIPWSAARRLSAMTTRSHSKSVVFSHSFELKGVDRILPPGEYRIVTDEELIEELSFPVYRRVATMIFVPGVSIMLPQSRWWPLILKSFRRLRSAT